MQYVYRISFALAAIAMFQTTALADKFDSWLTTTKSLE